MAAILRVRDEDGNIIEFPAIQGEKGEKGDKGDPGTVDLSGYATEDFVDANYIKKRPTTGEVIVTIKPDGSSDFIGFSMEAAGWTVARRDENGCVRTATPLTDSDATTKKYVDDAIAAIVNGDEVSY